MLHPLLEELFAIRKTGGVAAPAAPAVKGRKRGAGLGAEASGNSLDGKRVKSEGATLTANAKSVSAALASGDWVSALGYLRNMRSQKQIPKLGTVQRWVRLCDAAVHDPIALQVMDGILRTCDPDQTAAASASSAPPPGCAPETLLAGTLVRHPAWHAAPRVLHEGEEAPKRMTDRSAAELKALFRAIAHEAGPDRVPPNKHDLTVYTADTDVVDLKLGAPNPFRIDVPFVPQAFAMVDVLTRAECQEFIAAAESVGYSPDEPIRGDPRGATRFPSADEGNAKVDGPDRPRAVGLVWLACPSLNEALFERCRALLPAELSGGRLCGLNARWRLYRYPEGAVYRPHVDGAWPGSGLVDGKLEYDAYGDRWSRLTFLVYLNDDFEGGWTTYFTAGPVEGTLNARGVTPRTGTIVCFPHGDTAGSLVHEGSAVTSGTKYIIRSDVLYQKPEAINNS